VKTKILLKVKNKHKHTHKHKQNKHNPSTYVLPLAPDVAIPLLQLVGSSIAELNCGTPTFWCVAVQIRDHLLVNPVHVLLSGRSNLERCYKHARNRMRNTHNLLTNTRCKIRNNCVLLMPVRAVVHKLNPLATRKLQVQPRPLRNQLLNVVATCDTVKPR